MNVKIYSVLIVLILAGLFAWGYSTGGGTSSLKNVSPDSSKLLASESKLDLGAISMAEGNVERMFKISNPTDKDITIKRIETSCMCTTAYLSLAGDKEAGPFGMPGHGGPTRAITEVIKAGETRTLRVVFDPGAHGPAGVGPFVRYVFLTDSDNGEIALEIFGTVRP